MTVTTEQARADVADVLYMDVAELDHETDLRDQGMDSVRIMELVERWRSAGVEGIDFITLASDRRLAQWIQVLDDLQGDGADAQPPQS